MVIYQKVDERSEYLVEMGVLEEGEIQFDSGNLMELGDSQKIQLTENQKSVSMSLEPPVCKEIVPFRNDLDLGEIKEEGKDPKHKPSQRKKVEKKSNTNPKGVETRSSKVDQQAKVKPNVGTLDKPGRKSSRRTREMESMQNIADGRQATIFNFTLKIQI